MTVKRYFEILHEYNINMIEVPKCIETITEDEVRYFCKKILKIFFGTKCKKWGEEPKTE